MDGIPQGDGWSDDDGRRTMGQTDKERYTHHTFFDGGNDDECKSLSPCLERDA